MEISSSMLKSMRTLWFTNKKLFLNSNDSPKNIKSLVQKFNQHYTVFWKSRKSFRKLSKSRFRPNQISRSMRRRHKSNNKTTQLKSSYWIWFYTLKYIINMHLINMKTKGLNERNKYHWHLQESSKYQFSIYLQVPRLHNKIVVQVSF